MIENAPDVQKMQNAILAAPHHYASTDKKPMHQYCPKGRDSWCFFQKAKAAKPRSKPSHSGMKTTLNDKVFKAILPAYQRLGEKELVTRCKDLLTQNANESLHNVVWSYVPKINFVSKGRLEFGATQAVGKYNMGVNAMLTLEANLTERPASAQSMRLAQSDKQAEVKTKKARSAKKRAKKNKKTGKKDQYAPGGGD
ncbi:Pantothenate synthetase [Frankliniella fusca]|uniref:Pantothenate synthetase n=1 Tax=Frankliniella fusca TaxID=407009 RepID=A0AAE1I3Y8_9NEOP|nr:Pantothenate synthetase [Frankliniella fusca]